MVPTSDSTQTVKISGTVRAQDTWIFSRELQQKGIRLRNQDLILDLTDLEYASVEVLQYLASMFRQKRRPVKVTLVNTPAPTAEKIQRLGPLPYLRFAHSIHEALLGTKP